MPVPEQRVEDQLAQSQLELAEARSRSGHLEAALQSSRHIGIAIGILVERHRLTVDQAFHLLVGASQQQNLKLREVAERMTVTGSLEA